MREKVLDWFSWIDENRVRAAWIAVAVIALILIVRIVRPFLRRQSRHVTCQLA